MNFRNPFPSASIYVCLFISSSSFAQPDQKLTHDIFKELIEINTTHSTGNTTEAAEAMAARLKSAGFSDKDIFIGGPDPKKRQSHCNISWHRKKKTITPACTSRRR